MTSVSTNTLLSVNAPITTPLECPSESKQKIKPSPLPYIDTHGQLNSELAHLPNPEVGPKTYKNVQQKLSAQLLLDQKSKLQFTDLLLFIFKSIDSHYVKELLLIGSGAVKAIDSDERNAHFVSAGASQLLTNDFIQRLEKQPLDTDWRILLQGVSWDDIENYVRIVLLFLAAPYRIDNIENKSNQEIATSLGIFLDKSDGQFYILKFLNARIDLAIGVFRVHSLFDDTNVQICIDPQSVTKELSNLKLSFKTEEGINFLQALTYRGKGIITAKNPSEKDYRAFIHLIRRMMEGDACYSKFEVQTYIQTFLKCFPTSWPFHAPKKINNIFKGHQVDFIPAVAWAIFQCEIHLLHNGPANERMNLSNHIGTIWINAAQLLNNKEFNNHLIVKMRHYFRFSTDLVQAIIGTAIYINSLYSDNPHVEELLGQEYTVFYVGHSKGSGSHKLLIPGTIQEHLKSIQSYFETISNSSENVIVLLELFDTFCNPEELKFRAIKSDIAFDHNFICRWLMSDNSLLTLMATLFLHAKTGSGCKESQEILLSTAIPFLLCDSSDTLIRYGKALAQQLTIIAPSKSKIILHKLKRDKITHIDWLQTLAMTMDPACCNIAVKQWIANIDSSPAHMITLVSILEDVLKCAPLSALELLKHLLYSSKITSPNHFFQLFQTTAMLIKPHLNLPSVIGQIEILTEIASRAIGAPEAKGSPHLVWLTETIQNLRPDRIFRCLEWMPSIAIPASDEKSLSLAYLLATHAKSEEERCHLVDFIRQIFHLPGISEFLLSSVLLRALKNSNHLAILWGTFAAIDTLPVNKKIIFTTRWLEITQTDTAEEAELLPQRLRVIIEKALMVEDISVPSLQRLIFAAWNCPLIRSKHERVLVPPILKVLSHALKQRTVSLIPLANFVLQPSFLKELYFIENSATSLFPLLQALVFRREGCWKTALALAEELKSDQVVPIDEWKQLLTILSTEFSHQQDYTSIVHVATIFKARSLIQKLSGLYLLEALGIALRFDSAAAEAILKQIIENSSTFKTHQRDQLAILAVQFLKKNIKKSLPDWSKSVAFRNSVGMSHWLKCIHSFPLWHEDAQLFQTVLEVLLKIGIQEPSETTSDIAWICFTHPNLFESSTTAAEKWNLVIRLIPFLPVRNNVKIWEAAFSIIQELFKDKMFTECFHSILDLQRKVPIPIALKEKLKPMLSSFAADKQLTANSNVQNDLLDLKDFLQRPDWINLWNIVLDPANAAFTGKLFAAWVEKYPLTSSPPANELYIYQKAFLCLIKINSKTAIEFLAYPELVRAMLRSENFQPDEKDFLCLGIIDAITNQADEDNLRVWRTDLIPLISDPADRLLFDAKIVKAAFIIHAEDLLVDSLPAFTQALEPLDTVNGLLQLELEEISHKANKWKTFRPELLKNLIILSKQITETVKHPQHLEHILWWLIETETEDKSLYSTKLSVIFEICRNLLSTKQTKNFEIFVRCFRHSNKHLQKYMVEEWDPFAPIIIEIVDLISKTQILNQKEEGDLHAQTVFKLFLSPYIGHDPQNTKETLMVYMSRYAHFSNFPHWEKPLREAAFTNLLNLLLHFKDTHTFMHFTALLFNWFFYKCTSKPADVCHNQLFDIVRETEVPDLIPSQTVQQLKPISPVEPAKFYEQREQFFLMLLKAQPVDSATAHCIHELLHLFSSLFLIDFKYRSKKLNKSKQLAFHIEQYLFFQNSYEKSDNVNYHLQCIKKIQIYDWAKEIKLINNPRLINEINLHFDLKFKLQPKELILALKSLSSRYHKSSKLVFKEFMKSIEPRIIDLLSHEDNIDGILDLYKHIFTLVMESDDNPQERLDHLLLLVILLGGNTTISTEKCVEMLFLYVNILTTVIDQFHLNKAISIEVYYNVINCLERGLKFLIKLGLFSREVAYATGEKTTSWRLYTTLVDKFVDISLSHGMAKQFFDESYLQSLVSNLCLLKEDKTFPIPAFDYIPLEEKQFFTVKYLCKLITTFPKQEDTIINCRLAINRLLPDLLLNPDLFYFTLPIEHHPIVPSLFDSSAFYDSQAIQYAPLPAFIPVDAHKKLIHEIRYLGLLKEKNPNNQKIIAYTNHLLRELSSAKSSDNHDFEKAAEILFELIDNDILPANHMGTQKNLINLLAQCRENSPAWTKLFQRACLAELLSLEPFIEQKKEILLSYFNKVLDQKNLEKATSLMNAIEIYLLNEWDIASFESTLWACSLHLSLYPKSIDLFWRKAMHVLFKKKIYDGVLYSSSVLSDNLDYSQDDLQVCSAALMGLYATGNKFTNIFYRRVFQTFVGSSIIKQIAEEPALKLHSFLALLFTDPKFPKLSETSSVNKELLMLLMTSLNASSNQHFSPEDKQLLLKASPHLSVLLQYAYFYESIILCWLEDYFKTMQRLKMSYLGAVPLYNYLHTAIEQSTPLSLKSVKVPLLLEAGCHLSKHISTKQFHSLRIVFSWIEDNFSENGLMLLNAKIDIICNILNDEKKYPWAVLLLEELIQALEQKNIQGLPLPVDELFALFNQLKQCGLNYSALAVLDVLEKEKYLNPSEVSKEHLSLYEHAKSSERPLDALQILSKKSALRQYSSDLEIEDLFNQAARSELDINAPQILSKLMVQGRMFYHSCVKNLFKHFQNSAVSNTAKLCFFLALQETHKKHPHSDNVFYSNAWLWILENYSQNSHRLNLSFLLKHETIHLIQKGFLKSEELIKFNTMLYRFSLKAEKLTPDQLKCLLLFRNDKNTSFSNDFINLHDQQLVRHISTYDDIKLMLLLSQSIKFSLSEKAYSWCIINEWLDRFIDKERNLNREMADSFSDLIAISQEALKSAPPEIILSIIMSFLKLSHSDMHRAALSLIFPTYEAALGEESNKEILRENFIKLFHILSTGRLLVPAKEVVTKLTHVFKHNNFFAFIGRQDNKELGIGIWSVTLKNLYIESKKHGISGLKSSFQEATTILQDLPVALLKSIYYSAACGMVESVVTYHLETGDEQARTLLDDIVTALKILNLKIKDPDFLNNKLLISYFHSFPTQSVASLLIEIHSKYDCSHFNTSACKRTLSAVLRWTKEAILTAKKEKKLPEKYLHSLFGGSISHLLINRMAMNSEDQLYDWYIREVQKYFSENKWIELLSSKRYLLMHKLFAQGGREDVKQLEVNHKQDVILVCCTTILAYPTWYKIQLLGSIIIEYCDQPQNRSKVFVQDSPFVCELLETFLNCIDQISDPHNYYTPAFTIISAMTARFLNASNVRSNAIIEGFLTHFALYFNNRNNFAMPLYKDGYISYSTLLEHQFNIKAVRNYSEHLKRLELANNLLLGYLTTSNDYSEGNVYISSFVRIIAAIDPKFLNQQEQDARMALLNSSLCEIAMIMNNKGTIYCDHLKKLMNTDVLKACYGNYPGLWMKVTKAIN